MCLCVCGCVNIYLKYIYLSNLGVNGLVELWSVLLADGKILFLSSSVTALSSAMTGLMSITYPLGSEYV